MRRFRSTLLTGVNARPFPPRAAGFSIVELLITMVLLGIVLSIAVPSVRGWADNSNLRGASRMVTSIFYDARERAVAENRTYTVTFSPDPTNTCRIQAAAANNLTAYDQTRDFSEYKVARIGTVNGGTVPVVFSIQPRGTVSPDGTVVVTNTRNSTGTVNFVFTGRAYVSYSMQ
jgi:prepilin-type N-terminal cleavage/methylation domain-containing protein